MESQPAGTGTSIASMPLVRNAAELLAGIALARVQEKPSGRVRVEDYIAVLASLTGEAALVASGVFDIETTELRPGSAVFGHAINDVLTGDTADVRELAPNTVMGVLIRELAPAVVPVASFDRLEELYRHVAATVESSDWGDVATTVGDAHEPGILPIQVAFELRDAVDAAQTDAGLPRNLRHVPCALALAIGLRQVAGAIDMEIAVTLALEIVFGMAKMVPMSKAAFESVQSKPN